MHKTPTRERVEEDRNRVKEGPKRDEVGVSERKVC